MDAVYTDAERIAVAFGPVVVLVVAAFVLLILLATLVITAVIYCRIFAKAGYHWSLGLLILLPIVSVIMPFVLAFGHWPIQREVEELRRRLQPNVTPAPQP